MIHRLLFGAALLLAVSAGARDGLERWVTATRLPPLVGAVSQEVLDRDGHLLRAYPVEDGIWRLATTPRDVDSRYVALLLAAEDKRFHSHTGVDLRAMLRAGGQAVWHGRVVSGGSTLTMQTARLIENSGTGRLSGKLRQIRLALALERRLSKAEILSLYLTHAPFGGNIEGVRAASYAWFGKPPRRLSDAQAALLVALPQAPFARRPDRFPDAAKTARNRLLETHVGRASTEPLPQQMRSFTRVAPHLADRLRGADPDTRVLRASIKRDVQTQIADLARRAVDGLPPQTSAAILVADHQTGQVLAYVGSPAYGATAGAGFVDMVQAVRSPGSTLKPLIYALAFDEGLAHPETLIADMPVVFDGYAPQNFDGAFRGDVTVRSALMQSLNIPPLRLTEAMGPPRLMAGLRRSGATPRLPGGAPGLAVALGGVGLTLEELVQMYAGLANGGQVQPLSVQPTTQPDAPAQLVSARSAWQVGHILAGIQPPNGQPLGQVAFKTGTSYGHRDAWAIGWDGQHVIGVWLGRPDGTPVPGVFGGDVAAPILFEAFGRVARERTDLPPPPPDTLLLSNAHLPKPLRQFGLRSSASSTTFKVAFPPSGARLRLHGTDGVVLKLDGGTPPFVVLANDRPLQTQVTTREVVLTGIGAGFSSLTVIDQTGASDQVHIQID